MINLLCPMLRKLSDQGFKTVSTYVLVNRLTYKVFIAGAKQVWARQSFPMGNGNRQKC